MNILDKTISNFVKQMYEWGLVSDTTNSYDLSSDTVVNLIAKSSWNIEFDRKKLIYYSRHSFLPSAKKMGLTSALGGTVGYHKIKVPMMIWYIHQLYNRGYKHDEIRIHVYNYFSSQLPPKPVENTPMEERVLYNLRLNKKLFVALPTIEEMTVYTQKVSIPCWKLTVFDYYHSKLDPFYVVLIPKKNLTTQEANILSVLRTDNEYLKQEGFKRVSIVDGVSNIEYLEPLMIYKNYAMKTEKDNTDYFDLLDKNISYDTI